jgi:hypothetical protein
MKTFQDIMKEHPLIASQNTNQHIGTNDTLTRWYNMHWGALTDTHMQLMDDGVYIVTGTKLTKSLWEQIVYNRRLATAPNTVLPHSWNEVMSHNNLEYCTTAHNGAFAIAISRRQDNDTPVKAIEIPMVSTVVTPESTIRYGVVGVCDDGINA